MTEPVIGAGYLLLGLHLIRQRSVLPYVVIPVAINLAVFATTALYALSALAPLVDRIVPDDYQWLAWLLWPLVCLAVLVSLFYVCTLLSNIIAAPFNGPLAAAVETHLTGRRPESDGNAQSWIRGTGDALLSEGRKFAYYVVRAIPLFVLGWIPVVGLAAPFLWLIFSAWMLAVEYTDYPMGNHGIAFNDQRARLRTKRFVAFGFGGATLFLTLVPIVNFIAVPTAVAGATAMWVREFRQPESPSRGG